MEPATGPESSTLNDEPQAVVVRREPERDLLTWTAPARPFKRRSRRFYVTIFSIVGIISIILFIAEGVMPVVLLISFIFLFYVLSTVPPEEIEHKITNKGIRIAGKETSWQNILRFCFSSKLGSDVLVFDTATFYGRIELVINPEIKESLRREISAYAPYEEIPPSLMDKIVTWIAKKLPESE